MIEEDNKSGFLRLTVKVIPNAKKFEIINCDSYLKIKLTALNQDGKANEMLIEKLCEFFCVKKNSVKIIKGMKSHNKILLLCGITYEEAMRYIFSLNK